MRYLCMVVVVTMCAVIVAGCSSAEQKADRAVIGKLSPAIGGGESSCESTRKDRCAISSPLRERALALVDNPDDFVASHYVTLLDIGDEALQARVHLIRAAQKSIEIQTFIWGSDESGGLIFNELLEAARRGVQVRIIADQMYSRPQTAILASAAVAHRNLKIKLYNPVHGKAATSRTDFVKGVAFDFMKLNHRMHNKIMVIDGLIGIAGGRNIENKYFDRDPKFNFIDRDVLVIGPAATSMQTSFEEYWRDSVSRDLEQLKDIREIIFDGDRQREMAAVPLPDYSKFKRLSEQANDYGHIDRLLLQNAYPVEDVLFSADRPQKPFVRNELADQRIRGEFEKIIRGAHQSLLVQTPYFVLSNQAYRTLRELRKNNPDMEFTISTNSLASADHYYVYALAFKRKKRNVKNLGFNIFEFKAAPEAAEIFMPAIKDFPKSMLSIHAKSMVIDRRYAVIGSHNFDPRSSTLNTEAVVIIRNKEFARALENRIRLATAPDNSWLIARRQKVPVVGYVSGLFGTVSRALPVFDLWPFRYTSSFELREGKSPVRRDHPDFYAHYRNVGQFPGTGLGDKQIRSLLVGGFGAAVEPLM